jgi:nucleolar complex protein 2
MTDEEAAHKLELAALAEKDPEFYKYLQQNDQELLNFSISSVPIGDATSDDEDGGFDIGRKDENEDMEDNENERTLVLTSAILRDWQRAILAVSDESGISHLQPPMSHLLSCQTRSLRALRKLLVAFRSAARMNDDEDGPNQGGWKIEEVNGVSIRACSL